MAICSFEPALAEHTHFGVGHQLDPTQYTGPCIWVNVFHIFIGKHATAGNQHATVARYCIL